MKRLFAAIPAVLLLSAAATADDFGFDKTHTEIRASWVHGVSTQSLQFTDYDGTLDLDLENPAASTVDITFNLVGGMWAGGHHERFIAHLNSGDFFETEVNPTARFVATGFETADGQTGTMSGDLTMNGVTAPVSLAVTLNGETQTRSGARKLGFTATGSLMRSEWDMGFGTQWGISDEIELFISTELVATGE